MRDQECCLVLFEPGHRRLDQGMVVLPRRVKTQRWNRWVLLFFVVSNRGSKVEVGGEWWQLT